MTPRAKALIAGGALLALALAFAAGRFFAPAPDVHETERVVYKDRVVEVVKEVKVQQAAEVKRVVVYRDRVTTKDGTITEHEVERTDDVTKTAATTTTDTAKEATHEGTRTTERVVTTPRPDWRVGALVGASLEFSPSLGASLEVGAHGEYRLIGPLSVGAWVLVRPQRFGVSAGGSLSLEF